MTQFFLVTGRGAAQKRKCDGAFCVFYDTKDKNRTDAFFFFHAPKAQRMGNNYLISHNFSRCNSKDVHYSGRPFLYILIELTYYLPLLLAFHLYSEFIKCKTTSKNLSEIINFLLKISNTASTIVDVLSIQSKKLQCVFKLNNTNNMLDINTVSIISDYVHKSNLKRPAKFIYLSFLIDKRKFCVFETSRKELEDRFELGKTHLINQLLYLEQQSYIKRHHHNGDKNYTIELLPLVLTEVIISSKIIQIDNAYNGKRFALTKVTILNEARQPKPFKEYYFVEVNTDILKSLETNYPLTQGDHLYFSADLFFNNEFSELKNHTNFSLTSFSTLPEKKKYQFMLELGAIAA